MEAGFDGVEVAALVPAGAPCASMAGMTSSRLLMLLVFGLAGCQQPWRIEFAGVGESGGWSGEESYEEGWCHTNEDGR